MLWIAQPRFFPLGHCTHVFISREMPLAWICLGVYNIPLLTRAMTSICRAQRGRRSQHLFLKAGQLCWANCSIYTYPLGLLFSVH